MDTLTRQMDSLKSLAPMPDSESESAFQAVLALWRKRLADGWFPAETSSFPWEQVKRSLAALVQQTRNTPPNLGAGGRNNASRVLALICAGNTPLLAWPAMLFAVRHGMKLYVKMSRDETLWPRLLKESVAEVSPEAAARIELGVWPGEDVRTEKLIELSDAVIAYGSDATIERLEILSGEKPFLGFGHALSIAVSGRCPEPPGQNLLADDILMYDLQGCLSPQTIFVIGRDNVGSVVESLLLRLPVLAERLAAPPRTDPVACRVVRNARDLATMDGLKVNGDDQLRWTLIEYPETCVMPAPVGFGVVSLVPLDSIYQLPDVTGPFAGKISAVGFRPFSAWMEERDEIQKMLQSMGGLRLWKAGMMQTPPLSWKNGGVDLEAWIAGHGRDD